jgi:predicted DNA-binding transcriptional regulator YafY
VHYRDNWYLDAWCHKRQALRTFGVDAIEAVSVTDKPAREVTDDALERHLASGYGIFAGSATQEAVLQFGVTSARWVSRETWHPQQVGVPQLDGTFLLRFPYSQEPELLTDILQYGPDVQVLAPASLREAVAGKLRDAAKLYD